MGQFLEVKFGQKQQSLGCWLVFRKKWVLMDCVYVTYTRGCILITNNIDPGIERNTAKI